MTDDSSQYLDSQRSGAPDETASGAASATRLRSTGRRGMTGRRLAAVATGTTIALGAGGIAYATTGSPSAPTDSAATPTGAPTDPSPESGTPDDETAAPDERAHGPGWSHGGHGPAGMPFGFGMALHGEQVVQTEDGTYETIATQRGVIDELSADEVTVTSEDGYSRTYALADETLEPDPDLPGLVPDPADTDLAVGDEVMVVAQVDGTTAIVLHLRAVDALLEPGDRPAGPHGPWGDAQDGTTESAPS